MYVVNGYEHLSCKEGKSSLKIAYEHVREKYLLNKYAYSIWAGGIYKFPLCAIVQGGQDEENFQIWMLPILDHRGDHWSHPM